MVVVFKYLEIKNPKIIVRFYLAYLNQIPNKEMIMYLAQYLVVNNFSKNNLSLKINHLDNLNNNNNNKIIIIIL